jgi:hypothetical protein
MRLNCIVVCEVGIGKGDVCLIIDMSYSTYDGMVLRKSAIVTKY